MQNGSARPAPPPARRPRRRAGTRFSSSTDTGAAPSFSAGSGSLAIRLAILMASGCGAHRLHLAARAQVGDLDRRQLGLARLVRGHGQRELAPDAPVAQVLLRPSSRLSSENGAQIERRRQVDRDRGLGDRDDADADADRRRAPRPCRRAPRPWARPDRRPRAAAAAARARARARVGRLRARRAHGAAATSTTAQAASRIHIRINAASSAPAPRRRRSAPAGRAGRC